MSRWTIVPRVLRQIIAPCRCLFCGVLLEDAPNISRSPLDQSPEMERALRVCHGRLCRECLSELLPVEYHYCPRCGGASLPNPVPTQSMASLSTIFESKEPVKYATLVKYAESAKPIELTKQTESTKSTKCSQAMESVESTSSCVECFRMRQRLLRSMDDPDRISEVAFDSVTPLGVYDNLLSESILRGKRVQGNSITRLLSAMLYLKRSVRFQSLHIDAIVPIPLDTKRLRERETNDADRIAEVLSEILAVPVIPSLRKRRMIRPQKSLPMSEERFRNVHNMLRLNGTSPPVSGLRILVVDDVLTSGATCHEAARILKEKGSAAEVHIAVLARGGMRDTQPIDTHDTQPLDTPPS